MIAYLLLAIFIALQCGDWYTTRTILKNGGRELNPVLRYAFEKFSVDSVLCVKVVLLSVLVWQYCLAYPIAMLVLNGFYITVVVHNFKQMGKQ